MVARRPLEKVGGETGVVGVMRCELTIMSHAGPLGAGLLLSCCPPLSRFPLSGCELTLMSHAHHALWPDLIGEYGLIRPARGL
jgi:hypothetical protein